MEKPRYYELGDDNCYCVHFANKQGLSVEKIKDIFTEWGDVVGVTKAGDDYGYRFVRYRNEDEVKRCFEALKNNRDMRLLPKRPKNPSGEQQNNVQRNNKNNNRTNTWQDAQSGAWGSKISENFDKSNAQKTKIRDNENFRSSNDNVATVANANDEKDAIDYCGGKNISAINENSTSSSGRQDNGFAKVETKNISGHTMTLSERITMIRNPDNFKAAAAVPTKNGDIPIIAGGKNELLSIKMEIESKSKPAVSSLTAKDIAEIPDLVTLHQDSFTKTVSPMVTSKKPIAVNAEEIIVANVSADYSENFILHLFRKYDPICISPMKFIPSLAIRFCVVSFISAHQAKAVESEFDDHELGGKNLIVLRTQSLKELSSNIRL